MSFLIKSRGIVPCLMNIGYACKSKKLKGKLWERADLGGFSGFQNILLDNNLRIRQTNYFVSCVSLQYVVS